jgi:hypothetical protein
MALTTAGCFAICVMAQSPQDAGPQKNSGAFQHLPPMPSRPQLAPTPTKTLVRPPKSAVIEGQVIQRCAVPLLIVTPDNIVHYTIQTVNPRTGQVGAMAYVTTPPTCGDAGEGKK